MDHQQLKRDFAAALLRNDGDPFKAAFSISSDSGFCLQIARVWKDDPFVVAEQEKLLNSNDAKSFLPSKEQQARAIYAMASDEKTEPEDRLRAHKLYAEIMEHIPKPTTGMGVNILNQGVMIVKDAGSDADWEDKAARHQRALTLNAVN